MQKEMQELECEDGYLLMVEAAQQQQPAADQPFQYASTSAVVGTTTTTTKSVNKQNKTLLAMARSSSASSYASGRVVEKMAQKARARPAAPKVTMKTITSSDDGGDDCDTNNAIIASSPASHNSATQQAAFGHHQQASQNTITSATPALSKQDEDVIIVETVNEHEDDDDDGSCRKGIKRNHHENKSNTCDFSTFEYNAPQEAKHAIPMAMTILAVIFIIAVTALVFKWTHENRFLTASVWIVMAFIFIGLIFIIRDHLQDDTRTTRQVLLGFPLWDMVCTEYRNFKQDWREQVLLLKNVAENPSPDEPLTPPVAMDNDTSLTSSLNNDTEPAIAATTNCTNTNSNRSFLAGRKSRQQHYHQQQQQQQQGGEKRPKSKIFRVLVKPLLPMMIGRKRREQRRQEALELAGQVENGGVAILS